MDSQFQEVAAQITKDVTERVTQAVNAHVAAVVGTAEKRLTDQARANAEALRKQLGEAEKRLSDQARLNVEAVRGEFRLTAEAYAGTVDAIHRRLDRIEAKLDAKFGDYDAVMKNHPRIAILENKRA